VPDAWPWRRHAVHPNGEWDVIVECSRIQMRRYLRAHPDREVRLYRRARRVFERGDWITDEPEAVVDI